MFIQYSDKTIQETIKSRLHGIEEMVKRNSPPFIDWVDKFRAFELMRGLGYRLTFHYDGKANYTLMLEDEVLDRIDFELPEMDGL